MKENKYSLKEQFKLIFLIGYLSIILLLIILDFTSIFNYNSKIREASLKGFNQYFQSINDTMKKVNNIVTDVTLNSEEFTVMATSEDPIELNNAMFSLKKELLNQINMQQKQIGFVITNSFNNSRRYVFKKDISYENRNELLNQVIIQINANNPDSGWKLILVDDTYYCVKICEKKAGAIAGIFELDSKYTDITYNINGKGNLYVVLDNQVVNNFNNKANLELIKYLSEETNSQGKKIEDVLCYYDTFDDAGIGICIAIQDTIWNYLQIVQIILLAMTIGSIFIVVFLSRFILQQILRPLQALTDTMNQIRSGEIHAKMESDYKMIEFEEVKDTFHTMMEEIQELKIQSYEERIHKQKAQLLYYQLQLKPHFYLNCLKTLNALLSERQYDRMQDLIFDISDHMRYLLQSDQELVKVQAELDFVRSYMELQEKNYSRKFVWEVQMDSELLQEEIPALTIQTFVENTFKYAKLQESNGLLNITVKGILLKSEEGNYMDLSIRDNGCGYSDDLLEILNGPVEGIKSAGVGIANLLCRCNLIYNGKVEYYFQNDAGAVNELIIPSGDRGRNNE